MKVKDRHSAPGAETRMKIYLCGPMTGLPDLNFPAFHEATAHLRTLRFEVVNPAELNPDPTMLWHDCMKRDIQELLTCEGIASLPGWEKSKGASLEMHIAKQMGFKVFSMETETLKGVTTHMIAQDELPVAETAESVTLEGFEVWWKGYVDSGRHQYHELLHPEGIAKRIAKDAWDEAAALSTPHSEAVEDGLTRSEYERELEADIRRLTEIGKEEK